MTKWILIGIAIVVGGVLPFQAAMNAEITRRAGHGLHGALWNFIVGLCVLLTALSIFMLLRKAGPPDVSQASKAPWWAYFGGVMGAMLVMTTLSLVPRIGAVAMLAAIAVGQSLSSMVVDHFGWVNVTQRPMNTLRVVGIALLVAGILAISLATDTSTQDQAGPGE